MKLWERHLFSKLIKTFIFFLICLFVLYVIIDLSAHGVRFFSKANLLEILLYYLNTFSSELNLFLTFTFLLASLRVLFDLSIHREFLALQMAGISKKKLLTPLFYFAAMIALTCYINCQYFAPYTGEETSTFKTAYKAKKKTKSPKLYSAVLEDKSELVFHNLSNKELQDVFWVKNSEDIWHMKTLHIDTLIGTHVHHLTRKKQFEKSESYASREFSDLYLPKDLTKIIPYESRPLSTLIIQAMGRPADARIVFSHLYYKLLTPLLPFIIIMALGPIILRYTRTTPLFLIIALSIFALLGLKTILDGMLILGENQVLPSYIAIFSPMIIVFSVTLVHFRRMT